MTYLFYFDRLGDEERAVAILGLGTFVFTEAGILVWLLPEWRVVSYLVGGAAALALGLRLASRNAPLGALVRGVPWIDLATYALVIVGTVAFSRTSASATLPPGALTSRLDLDLFVVVLVFVSLAVVPVGLNDVHVTKKPARGGIRSPEYIAAAGFGHRRWFTAIVGLVMLGAVCALFLLKSPGLGVSASVVLAFGLAAPFVFEYLYGYRSFIMRVFLPTLSGTAALAYLLRSPYESFIPPILVLILAAAWVFMWGRALQQVWRETDSKTLVLDQRFWHSAYLCILGAGHAVIYVLWIYPIRGLTLG